MRRIPETGLKQEFSTLRASTCVEVSIRQRLEMGSRKPLALARLALRIVATPSSMVPSVSGSVVLQSLGGEHEVGGGER